MYIGVWAIPIMLRPVEQLESCFQTIQLLVHVLFTEQWLDSQFAWHIMFVGSVLLCEG